MHCLCRKLCRMDVLNQQRNTAGNYDGQLPGENPVACDSGHILYNLNIGTYLFNVQASDVTVRTSLPVTI